MSELEQIQELYDRGLFQQAYRLSARYWSPATDIAQLSIEELILGGRLAGNLGGYRLSRWLHRAAIQREPEHPHVKYFTQHLRRRGWHFAEELRAIQQNPELGGDDAQLQAWWRANWAMVWAKLRDFERAFAWIERAHALAPSDSWVFTCESVVLGIADRWPEALETVERAWSICPGDRHALQSLCDSLVHLGRLEEAAERAVAAAEHTESYTVASCAAWHLCALAETCAGEARRTLLDQAGRMLDRLPALMPLADREAQSVLARAKLDLADLLGDHEEMARCAEQARSPYHRRVAANLRKNPQGARILLPYRRVQQKHMACVPTSVSVALDASGIALEADEMAADTTFGGTFSWVAAEWLEQRGLVVRFFVVNADVAVRLIRNGIPFVLSMAGDDSGHAVAVIGVDEAAGIVLIHDPGYARMLAFLLEEIGRHGGPTEPEGMAIVWPERAALLDSLLEGADPEAAEALQRFAKADHSQDPEPRRLVVEDLARRFPSHPGTRFLKAVLALAEGESGEALGGFQLLMAAFPNSVLVRRLLLSACRSFGNLALTRQVLEEVAQGGVLPPMGSGQSWSYPPSTYVAQYADLLHTSADTRAKARGLLRSVLDREGGSAEAWHILGDLLWQEHDREGALLGYRLASCLQNNNEHYARAYASALHTAGREDEGLGWLERRVREFGGSPWGAGPWIGWVAALEDFGYPDRALTACQAGLEQHGGAPEFLVFATAFFGRIGHWEEAESSLRRLEDDRHSTAFCEAAVQYHSMRGELQRAIEYCEEWVGKSPQQMDGREQLLDLVAKRDGARPAAALAKRWLAERPLHDRLEELHYWQLYRTGETWKRDLVLARRVRRNPADAWAWLQSFFCRAESCLTVSDQRREKIAPRLTALLAECERTAPGDARTLQARALWAEIQGNWSEAIVLWREAVEKAPGVFYYYQHLWGCGAGLDDAGRRQLFAQVETVLLDAPGPLGFARDMLFLVADRFGLTAAEEAVARWQATRPGEPELIEAEADLLLKYGVGKAASLRARDLLRPAIERLPYHAGLRLLLVDACRNLGEQAEAAAGLREIVRRHPGHTDARVQLARVQHSLGEHDEAQRLLDTAAAGDPRNVQIWTARQALLRDCGRTDEAREVVQEALRDAPDDIAGREWAVEALFGCEDAAGAVEAARQGVSLSPNGGRQWRLLANALERAPNLAAEGEIEKCLRRAVALDARQFHPADLLATKLTEQEHYDEAEELMTRIAPRMADASPAHGRLAWIHGRRGHTAEGIQELADAIAKAPWYAWGWRMLLACLREEQNREMALTVFAQVPPEMRWNEDFRSARMAYLSDAGAPGDQLGVEAKSLVEDFPETVPHRLGYYDWLHANGRREDAAAMVRSAEQMEPDNIYMRARLVETLCEEGNQEAALEGLERVWFASEPHVWPAEYAWTAIGRAHVDEEAYERARELLAAGQGPTPPALRLMASHAMHADLLHKKPRQPLWRTWFPGRGAREVLALLVMMDRAHPAPGEYRGILLHKLSEAGYQRLVVRYYDERPLVVETDIRAWTVVTEALVTLGSKRRARKLFAGWSDRKGVPMAAAANYVACFPRRGKKNLRAILNICQSALAKLPHDRCAKYLAHVQAHVCVLLRDREAFEQTWKTHRRYFTGNAQRNEWFDPQYRHLLYDVQYLGQLLDSNWTRQFEDACKLMRRHQPLNVEPDSTLSSVIAATPPWIWLALAAVLSLLLSQLFNNK